MSLIFFACPSQRITSRSANSLSFDAAGWKYRVRPKELEAEIHDIHQQILGKPSAIEACISAYQANLKEQTADTLKALRRSYEAVPEHLRPYCGDMDVKDVPIRMILYGTEEIENWSHFQVAKERGLELPSIRIPDPPGQE